MNWQWLSTATLLAALVIGFSVMSQRDDAFDAAGLTPSIHGYYLKDAIITETAPSGAPRARFAASEVAQDVATQRMLMKSVRADYVWIDKDRADRWVLNADQLWAPDAAAQKKPLLELRGNVEAHSVGAAHDTSLRSTAIDIDTERQIARSNEAVTIALDGHITKGTGLVADLAQRRVKLRDGVTMQAPASQAGAKPTDAAQPPALSLPEIFEFKQFDYNNNVLTLTDVRSKSEPFISAAQARATGADIANNQWELRGGVRMELPKRGRLAADVATITIRNGAVTQAQVSGAPVTFEHQGKDEKQLVRGRAQTIDYDVATQRLRFLGQAWFNDGQFEITSDLIEYNLGTGAAHGSRVEGTMLPRKSDATPR